MTPEKWYQKKIIDQIIDVLLSEAETIDKMIDDNTDLSDDAMCYVLFAWRKYAEEMREVALYFAAMRERDGA